MTRIRDAFGPETYGALYADDYDDTYDPKDGELAADFLAALAKGGQALELAIGTGRVALPLAARGVAVSGVEASEAMVAKLRAKPGGDAIPVTIGDFADAGPDGPFSVAYLVFNTLFNLTAQARQVACFANVAARLAPGGVFVVQAFVPDFAAYQDDRRLTFQRLSMEGLWIDAVEHDRAAQILEFQRARVTSDGVRCLPLALRYVWPAEMDLMARLAGLRLRERWAGWDRSPFDSSSKAHISVYEKPS